jgi:hypothetical protein
VPAAERDHLGNPVAGDHQRLDPLDAGDARPAARRRNRAPDAIETFATGGDEAGAGVGHAGGGGDADEVVEHVLEAIGPQRYDAHRRVEQRLRRPLHFRERHRAHLALDPG